jgi:hypothetical protein
MITHCTQKHASVIYSAIVNVLQIVVAEFVIVVVVLFYFSFLVRSYNLQLAQFL